ncbi:MULTISPECIES: prephenate dehydrogenase [Persicobacter]|uniref:Prephenate dehydrogenase n=1 Tax=Persicobacter diffluens TaxID=981 RepID=A0AAN5ALN5_9BACT|nr:prephenate dehydrogenase [Persicobacter sp. CCB-QB2]GJM61616.1 prephenate dehydrogenase [Persicobacter diffluens]
MKICVIGLGLLGGSFALSVKDALDEVEILGVDINPGHSQKALELGIIDKVMTLEEAVPQSSIAVLATPVNIIEKQILTVLDLISPTGVVIDLGSTKENICLAADDHPQRLRYVATHPIAGTENSGPESAFKGLFRNKSMIICDRQKSDPLAYHMIKSIFKDMGMRVSYMNSIEHDKHIAYVSHLSHISSFALGATVLDMEKNEKNIFAMAGSGFSSTVRLAKSSPEMWAPIFEQNADNISLALGSYIEHLQDFKQIIDNKDMIGSTKIMKRVNDIRRVLKGIDIKS